MNPPPPAGAAAGFHTLHPEIIDSHILSRLNGPALASAACCSTALRRQASHHNLWLSICHSTWPATASPRLTQLISTFPGGGPRAFFSHAFPLLSQRPITHPSSAPPEILSAVDIHYDGKLIFTKLHSTETGGDWFRWSPFRVDLLELKDSAHAAVKISDGDGAGMHEGILDRMTLSWILIDPAGRRAANLSSHEPVSVRRHWLTGEMEVRFGSILGGDGGHVQCGIVVTCGGEMEVKGVRLEMEDMDGKHLNGKESVVILQGALVGKKGAGKNRGAVARRRYAEFEEMKKERRERELRREGDWDMVCLAIGVSIYFYFWYYFL
ncbi:probable F-box protein At2g36090 [Salvia miltiorrhiza]|uniref:probable F-box protein At2g36090 n=1 Tax=Salvia miltiorrhiza TaxID=226208 RepID=UPI0025AC4054|nr:probable F-box protein At2g36090 [Salvia miltiorrhiza]